MKEIIVKSEDDFDLSLENIENKYLRVIIREVGGEIQFMDFTLSEIDELQEAISIMKDKLSRKLSPKKETFEFELPTSMSVEDFEKLTGCKCKPSNEKLTTIVTSTDQKDVNNVSDNEQKLTYGGEIAGFPIEVVERMLECQVEQRKKRNVSVFERNKSACSYGFDWTKTKEGYHFWVSVISNKNFAIFFQKYPKKSNQ